MVDLKLEGWWPEYLTGIFFVGGLVIAILIESVFFAYLSSVLLGFLVGKYYFLRKDEGPILPVVLVGFGLFLGFVLGNIFGEKYLIFLFFMAAAYLSNLGHEKGWIKIAKTRKYVR